jgi:Ala-tRNA(Pro) deacylase
MPIAPTLGHYLANRHVDYDLVAHQATASSLHTAGTCDIPADRLAKGVVLRAGDGYVLVVLPASHRISRGDLKARFGRDCEFATEHELDQLFPDCAHGAVPPLGDCYGLDVLVEDSMREPPEIYFEAGDHATLVHMSQAQFERLTAHAPHGCFTART